MEKVKALGVVSNYNVKHGVTELKLEFDATQLPKMIRLFTLLGKDFKAGAKLGDTNKKLGEFSIWSVKVDRDGETTLQLRSDTTSIEKQSLSELLEEPETVSFMFMEMEQGEDD